MKATYSYASGVLLKSNMPATIAETVFITSDAEANLLKNGGGTRQMEIAQKLKAALSRAGEGTRTRRHAPHTGKNLPYCIEPLPPFHSRSSV